ncbi:metallophosphoesterase [Methanobrevibacter sp.]|uniref:metallophosphoesterase n=1 Tax=Methanobrevibacter sp. TaxID=66852 RepID=UPI00388F6AEB
MSFRTRRVIFITPFYTLFEFFLLKYILLLLGGVWDGYLLISAVLIGILHVSPMFFEAKKSRRITRFLSTVDGVWMWASVMFLIDILVIYLIGSFVEIPHVIVLILLAVVPVLGVYNYYKAHKLVVHEKTLTFDNIESEIAIAHLSDIHFGSVRHKGIIRDVALKLKELEGVCDIAVISGDLADGSSVVEEDDFMALADVQMPILFTPGNHDFYPGIDNVIRAAKKAGIIVLDNDSFEFKNLNIYGLTFSFDDIEMPSAEDLKSSLNPDKINIINYHPPSYWPEFSSLGFDLQLSGHSHGGQFYPAVWFANRVFEYNMGLFRDKLGNYIHVTTGVGSMDTPMRWGTDSEIVVLKLEKS